MDKIKLVTELKELKIKRLEIHKRETDLISEINQLLDKNGIRQKESEIKMDAGKHAQVFEKFVKDNGLATRDAKNINVDDLLLTVLEMP